MTSLFRPVAEPQIVEQSFTEDQHRRLDAVMRRSGPHSLILAQYFTAPSEVVATLWDKVPEDEQPSWDMFLTPVFRSFLGKGGVCFHPEVEDCFLNSRFLDLARSHWGAKYAHADEMYFSLQGPARGGDTAHVDATRFRGISMNNSPTWLMNLMAKSGLFKRWQAKKAQVATWYYKGRVGGGFTYWPNGPDAPPKQIKAPMWGRVVVVENEMMYHTAEATGPAALRQPEGLAFQSLLNAEPGSDGWQITTDGRVIQRILADEMRVLIHWSADVFMDDQELKVSLDQSDDLSHAEVFDIFIRDMRRRGERIEVPSDPMKAPTSSRTSRASIIRARPASTRRNPKRRRSRREGFPKPDLFCAPPLDRADRCNAAVLDGDIGNPPIDAGAVDYRPRPNNEITLAGHFFQPSQS